jgi:hypothetical protein
MRQLPTAPHDTTVSTVPGATAMALDHCPEATAVEPVLVVAELGGP